MFKWTLLLLVALSLLVSIDAITAPAARSAVKLPVLSGKYDKRSLRGFMSDDQTATEERATVGGVQKLKTLLTTNKLGEKIAAIKKAHLAKREAFVKKLVTDGADFDTLLLNKVTGNEMIKALAISKKDVQYGHLLSRNYIQEKAYVKYVETFGKKRGPDYYRPAPEIDIACGPSNVSGCM